VIEIFRRKTAPAFGVALQLGAVAAAAEGELLETLKSFSESLGIAYQIRDDLEEYNSGEAQDLRASLLLALANDHSPAAPLTSQNPQLRHILDELMVPEKAAQLLEHYKNEAIRALNPLKNALLKSLLRRITTKMLGGG
jgi:geranylgeranyl diphosphate synthase type II